MVNIGVFLIHNFGVFFVDVAKETNTSLGSNLSLQIWVCAGGLSYSTISEYFSPNRALDFLNILLAY